MEIDIGGLALFTAVGILVSLLMILILAWYTDHLKKEIDTVKVILSRHHIMAVATV